MIPNIQYILLLVLLIIVELDKYCELWKKGQENK